MRVAISGASGLVGTALREALSAQGHEVRPMRRGASLIDLAALEGADAVVNLAGAGIGDVRWSKARKAELVKSRVDFTRALVQAATAMKQPPRVLLSGSATGIYGDRGDELLTEGSAIGSASETGAGFLVGLCQAWEAEARPLSARVVNLRLGVVLTEKGGALPKMLTPFRAGVGGRLGDGRQWMSWIGLGDVLGALLHALTNEEVRGPMNVVAPGPVTNEELTRAVGKALSRPTLLPAPAFALRLALGEMADAALLASQRVKPGVLESTGYRFVEPALDEVLARSVLRLRSG